MSNINNEIAVQLRRETKVFKSVIDIDDNIIYIPNQYFYLKEENEPNDIICIKTNFNPTSKIKFKQFCSDVNINKRVIVDNTIPQKYKMYDTVVNNANKFDVNKIRFIDSNENIISINAQIFLKNFITGNQNMDELFYIGYDLRNRIYLITEQFYKNNIRAIKKPIRLKSFKELKINVVYRKINDKVNNPTRLLYIGRYKAINYYERRLMYTSIFLNLTTNTFCNIDYSINNLYVDEYNTHNYDINKLATLYDSSNLSNYDILDNNKDVGVFNISNKNEIYKLNFMIDDDNNKYAEFKNTYDFNKFIAYVDLRIIQINKKEFEIEGKLYLYKYDDFEKSLVFYKFYDIKKSIVQKYHKTIFEFTASEFSEVFSKLVSLFNYNDFNKFKCDFVKLSNMILNDDYDEQIEIQYYQQYKNINHKNILIFYNNNIEFNNEIIKNYCLLSE